MAVRIFCSYEQVTARREFRAEERHSRPGGQQDPVTRSASKAARTGFSDARDSPACSISRRTAFKFIRTPLFRPSAWASSVLSRGRYFGARSKRRICSRSGPASGFIQPALSREVAARRAQISRCAGRVSRRQSAVAPAAGFSSIIHHRINSRRDSLTIRVTRSGKSPVARSIFRPCLIRACST